MKKLAIATLVLTITVSMLATTVEAQRSRQRGQRGQRDDGLKVAEMAPTFVLKSLEGSDQTDLASFRGEKPVVLFFGSYT